MRKTKYVLFLCAGLLLAATFSVTGATSLSRSEMTGVCGSAGGGCPITYQTPEWFCEGLYVVSCPGGLDPDPCVGLNCTDGCTKVAGNIAGGSQVTGTWASPVPTCKALGSTTYVFPCEIYYGTYWPNYHCLCDWDYGNPDLIDCPQGSVSDWKSC